MSKEKKNMDIFLDEKIKNSLHTSVSHGFTNNLMQQIELEAKFAQEDIKTGNIVKYVVSSISLMLLGFLVILGVTLSKSGSESRVTSWTEDLAFYFELIPEKLFGLFGLSFQSEIIFLAGIIIVFTLLFTSADKYLLRKKAN